MQHVVKASDRGVIDGFRSVAGNFSGPIDSLPIIDFIELLLFISGYELE